MDASALARLAAAVRALIAATVNLPDETAATDAAEEVESLVARLTPRLADPPLSRYPAMDPPPSGASDLMPFDLVLGRLNPIAPPITFTWEGGRSIGRVTFTRPYEGPPGCVHGGMIAAAFDQVLSVANVMAGTAGPTAELTIRYRKPTPLGVEVRFEGWQTRVAGRRIHAAGRLLAGDEVTVEAEGIFVQLPGGRVMKMLES
jgi:acyl-coenzyme A thioesterase PaaI-like protein